MIEETIIHTYKNHESAEDLLNNAQFYTSLFDYHPDAVYAVDQTGSFILANPALQSLTGYSLHELIQQNFTNLKTSDTKTRVERLEKALQGEPQKYETTVFHKQGHAIDVFVTLIPIVINGEIVGAFGFAKDISERKRNEEQLRQTNALFTLLSENTQDLITISDPNGFTQYISTSVQTVLGYEPEEVLKVPTTLFWHPEDIENISKQNLSTSGSFECRIKHKQGHYLWFETIFKMIINESNQVESVVGIGRNITERKLAEEKLLETKDLLDSFINQNVDAIAFFDQRGLATRINDSYIKMFGWTKEEILGTYITEFPNIPEEERDDAQETIDLVLKNQQMIGLEKRRIRKDGSVLSVRLSCFPLHSSRGEVQGWAVVMRDITEQKQAEELLRQTEKLSVAGQLAAGIAHEIRNPLTAIKGFTQLMKMGEHSHPEYLKIMEQEMTRIESILSELLVLAKPQVHSFDQKVNIGSILSDVVSLMQTQAIMYNIGIVFENHLTATHLFGDQNQLKQVFINFVKNAIEAMPKGGQLTIDLRLIEESQLRICFQDEGVGIHPSLLKRIGEPFYTTKEKGTGLGMMVSKKIIENHRGQLKIESELDVGTTVEVILPITTAIE